MGRVGRAEGIDEISKTAEEIIPPLPLLTKSVRLETEEGLGDF